MIVNLNYMRKYDPKLASILSKKLLDTVMLSSGINVDTTQAHDRSYTVLEKMLDNDLKLSGSKAQRKLKAEA